MDDTCGFSEAPDSPRKEAVKQDSLACASRNSAPSREAANSVNSLPGEKVVEAPVVTTILSPRRRFVVRQLDAPPVSIQGLQLTVPQDEQPQTAPHAVTEAHKADGSVEEEKSAEMNSTDSLNGGSDDGQSCAAKTPPAAHQVDTLLPGAELQESPRGGSANSSVSSPASAHRDTASSLPPGALPVTSMPQFCAGGAAPMSGHQLLVDPATGQHYLVPSGPPTHQPLFYHPVYYTAAPAHPLYYQPFTSTPQGAYIMASPVTSGQPGVLPLLHASSSLGPRFSTTTPAASVPPSLVGGYAHSVADSEDLRSLPVGEDHHSFLQHRLMAQADANRVASDCKNPRVVATKSHSPPSISPPLIASRGSIARHSGVFLSRPDQLIESHASPAASSSTLGLDSRTPKQDSVLSGQRSAMFSGSSPSWWGECRGGSVRSELEYPLTDVEMAERRRERAPDRFAALRLNTAMSDSEAISASRAPPRREKSPSEGVNVRRPLKPIRMDIDLNKPFEDEEAKKKEEKAKVVMRAPPTAFTVSFDSDDAAKLSLQDAARKSTTRRLMRRSAPVASTDAKFSTPSASRLSDCVDPKQYLLNKMLMGSGAATEVFNGASEFIASSSSSAASEDVKDSDALSEAGTYVVDEKDRRIDPQMSTSQCINESDEESDSDSSECTRTSTRSRSSDRTPSPSSTANLSQISPLISSRSQNSPSAVTGEKSELLLRELLRISAVRQQQQQQQQQQSNSGTAPSRPSSGSVVGHSAAVTASSKASSTNSPSAMAATSVVRACMAAARSTARPQHSGPSTAGAAALPTRAAPRMMTGSISAVSSTSSVASSAVNRLASRTPASSTATNHSASLHNHASHHSQCVAAAATAAASSPCSPANANFRRGDGGRFSMRTSSTGAAATRGPPPSTRNTRPPFRVGGSTRIQGSSGGISQAQKESAEMTAWLRRKDYNPMKAAAEAKKMQLLKARSDNFTSCRSISFHQGAPPDISPLAKARELSSSRQNRSQDNLLAEAACCGPETILASYSKGITRDLQRLKLDEESAQTSASPQTSLVEKAVQVLASKCNRSIELIRNAHHGHLSDSVESLLERAVRPAKESDGTVTEQLDRLSAAFDAIQKYLEVSSSPSVPTSPSASSSSTTPSFPTKPSSPSYLSGSGTLQTKFVSPKRTKVELSRSGPHS